MLRNDLFGSLPGQGAGVETTENVFRWARDVGGLITAGWLDAAAVDAGSTPTNLIRSGLLMGTVTATGRMVAYNPTATDGSDQVTGAWLVPMRTLDTEGNTQQRLGWVLVGGPVKASQLYGLDEQARAQMAGRFTFDDRNYLPNFSGIVRTIAKPAGYTVLAADNNTLFTTTGAGGAVTFILPAAAKGLRYKFFNTVGQNMVIQAPAGKLVALNNAAATTLTFSTAGNLIGSGCEVFADEANNKWLAMPFGTATPTVA